MPTITCTEILPDGTPGRSVEAGPGHRRPKDQRPMTEPTPWAPSQHAGMRCICRHWDARECYKARHGHERDTTDRDFHRCDCCCHDRDHEDT